MEKIEETEDLKAIAPMNQPKVWFYAAGATATSSNLSCFCEKLPKRELFLASSLEKIEEAEDLKAIAPMNQTKVWFYAAGATATSSNLTCFCKKLPKRELF